MATMIVSAQQEREEVGRELSSALFTISGIHLGVENTA